MEFRRIGHLKDVYALREHLATIDPGLPIDPAPIAAADGSPLARPIEIGGRSVGNRWCIHPMEGWDATPDGLPTDRLRRRWRHFGESGAKLIWGGEAFAVCREGRANPNQLYLSDGRASPMRQLLAELRAAHTDRFGVNSGDDLMVGLQLTHSGRFCRPNRKDRLEPRIAYHHPVLDAKFGIDASDDAAVLSDGDIDELVDRYVDAALMAADAGFDFVDVKHCHGYLGHELLSAYDRPGRYGGSFENRTRFLREIVSGIRTTRPDLLIGVRLSLFDMPPFRPDATRATGRDAGPGVPELPSPDHARWNSSGYPGFGLNRDAPLTTELSEPIRLLELMRDGLQVAAVNLTAGSPYYNPHIQRPASAPPSDGYGPPEDPLVGCVRQMRAVQQARSRVPGLPVVGTAYTYLQQFVPHVAQALVRAGWTDLVGLGRMALSYWDLPADVLEGRPIDRRRICRTFSDCTTAPRNGLASGCFPLDPFYRDAAEHDVLKRVKADIRTGNAQNAAS